ncbi:MAG: DUF3016 domain-containing protein [Paraglaciecola sp.]|uniref:DUF3016 domain-containing protein n=1 Tax=Pseudomonadati TaxID=3379134 RepID=UPI00273F9304|nr:DUF3016 domain-containing protein [Paraglaciecola sp.]MDP5032030.1 DUF3016 domain-containing protein [Paraglaciecola sp.]MDP5040666.1 DUF3016 domain-containing protein [Paraglaciecola sp.]MDP5131928.1 DUF3016 domain-containing protein [Paraglaciecola sp.]
MKKLIVPLVASSLALISVPSFSQAEVEVNWQNPESYRDVRPTGESRKRFREHTFAELQDYIVKLAEQLPQGQKLTLNVTNLDLAGQVWPASFVGLGHSTNDVRVVKNIDIPRMSFSYTLTNKAGEIVQQAEVDLKDMAFMDRANRFFDSENLRYEKNMLKSWFDAEFPALVVKN